MYRFVDASSFEVLYNTLVDNEIRGQVYDGSFCGYMTNKNSLNVLSSSNCIRSRHTNDIY